MALSNSSEQIFSKPPERLSGHDLVNYLIDHPQARGNFKWHTLRSCMWRDLLIAQPSFEDVANFKKIILRDGMKIMQVHPQLYHHFEWKKIHTGDWRAFLEKNPEFISAETTAHFRGWDWSEFLKKKPEFAPLCPWEELEIFSWINLIKSKEIFADRCPWDKFRIYHWVRLLGKKRSCLKYFNLKVVPGPEEFVKLLSRCYFGDVFAAKGIFDQDVPDVSTYLILKQMDRENGKRFLKKQYQTANWRFIEALADISPEDSFDVHGKTFMPFYLVLNAPDSLFEKLLPVFDPEMRDPGGNSLLLPALVGGLCGNSLARYEQLLAMGLNPDEKNLAGFSCNDVINYFKNQNTNQHTKGKKHVR